MSDFLIYLFWPNPGNARYDTPTVMLLIGICVAMIVAAIILSMWRKKLQNPQMRKISRSWPASSVWFGFIGLLLAVSRVEQIQFLAMRALWGVWLTALVLYVVVQIRGYRSRYYEVLPTKTTHDPRSKYLPRRKNR
jgi:hypothetical protein